jgi:murein DD-endopeptidase MepM/ murein hydrolase activator NlpD
MFKIADKKKRLTETGFIRILLTGTLTLSLLLAFDVSSGKILRFVDENGVTHYTDDESEAQGYDYDEFDDLGQPDPDNVIFRLDTETGSLYVMNKFNSTITCKVHVTNKDAIDSDILFDTPLEIPGNTEYYLGRLEVISDEEVSITNSFDIGSLFKGDENVYYSSREKDLIVPFVGKYRVTQGWEGGFTHKGPKSRYAIDVAMPIGTKILAAKSGKVMDMRMSSDKGGPDPSFRPHANYIRIGHDDGTMSIYVHLKGHSQLVKPGDTVRQGQVIALSGNTGYTTGPHLHFAIQTNTGNGIKSIKFKLNGKEPFSGTPLSN